MFMISLVLFAVLKQNTDSIPTPIINVSNDKETSTPLVTLVTGANSGIGYAVSEELVRQGNIVLMACRSESRCSDARVNIINTITKEQDDDETKEETATKAQESDDEVITLQESHDNVGKYIYIVHGLDLSSPKAINELVEQKIMNIFNNNNNNDDDDDSNKDDIKTILNNKKTIDLLIFNAGFIPSGNHTSVGSGWESGLGDMHLGHFTLIKSLISNQLIDSLNTVLVSVSSDFMRFGGFHDSILINDHQGDLKGEYTTGLKPTPIPTFAQGFLNAMSYVPDHFTLGAYGRVKLANVYFSRELERRGMVKRAVSVHPGTVHTSIVNLEGWMSVAQDLLAPLFLRSAPMAANVVLTAAVEVGALKEPSVSATATLNKKKINNKEEEEDLVSTFTGSHVGEYPKDKWLHYANGQGHICPRSCLKFKSFERNDAIARALWDATESAWETALGE